MNSGIAALPTRDDVLAGRVRLTVDEYERLAQIGILKEADKVELIDGWVREKMAHDPIHAGTVRRLDGALLGVLPSGWDCRAQRPVILAASVPEPDNSVVRRDPDDYTRRHPTAQDTVLVAEVANSSLDYDRDDKLEIYALAGIPPYWIVNVVDRQIEVCTNPAGDRYGDRNDFFPGEAVPLFLDGVHVNAVIA
ncbi:MAG: Uma2 family endonuclease [Gemmataceae bacterium]|nr:Uma2 family endonuclease [Gemmataceae bacterium]